MSALTPTTVWRLSPALVLALDDRLGAPVDSYVNGTQTWLTSLASADDDDGPTLEWRLHPVAGYRTPAGCSHYDVWDEVVAGLSDATEDPQLTVGEDMRLLSSFWDGLECFPAYGDEIEPAGLARAATELLGIPPDAAGLVDHERVGREWERARGRSSIIAMLLEELGGSA